MPRIAAPRPAGAVVNVESVAVEIHSIFGNPLRQEIGEEPPRYERNQTAKPATPTIDPMTASRFAQIHVQNIARQMRWHTNC